MKTIRQTSAGCVIYKRNGSVKVILIARKNKTVWCLPKGKIEEGEDEATAAGREALEETGVQGRIERKLGDITYWFYLKEQKSRVFKRVHFYLMRYESGEPYAGKDPDSEAEDAQWFDIDKALEAMTYPSERQMVEKAKQILKRN